MPFKITLAETAHRQHQALEFDRNKKDWVKLEKVCKCQGYLQINPRHPSLGTHEYSSMRWENAEKVWEAYAENRTSSAGRVFWHYGPSYSEITIVAVTAFP